MAGHHPRAAPTRARGLRARPRRRRRRRLRPHRERQARRVARPTATTSTSATRREVAEPFGAKRVVPGTPTGRARSRGRSAATRRRSAPATCPTTATRPSPRHIANAASAMLTVLDDQAAPDAHPRQGPLKSPRKIDAAMAAVLSWEARCNAMEDGAVSLLTTAGARRSRGRRTSTAPTIAPAMTATRAGRARRAGRCHDPPARSPHDSAAAARAVGPDHDASAHPRRPGRTGDAGTAGAGNHPRRGRTRHARTRTTSRRPAPSPPRCRPSASVAPSTGRSWSRRPRHLHQSGRSAATTTVDVPDDVTSTMPDESTESRRRRRSRTPGHRRWRRARAPPRRRRSSSSTPRRPGVQGAHQAGLQ